MESSGHTVLTIVPLESSGHNVMEVVQLESSVHNVTEIVPLESLGHTVMENCAIGITGPHCHDSCARAFAMTAAYLASCSQIITKLPGLRSTLTPKRSPDSCTTVKAHEKQRLPPQSLFPPPLPLRQQHSSRNTASSPVRSMAVIGAGLNCINTNRLPTDRDISYFCSSFRGSSHRTHTHTHTPVHRCRHWGQAAGAAAGGRWPAGAGGAAWGRRPQGPPGRPLSPSPAWTALFLWTVEWSFGGGGGGVDWQRVCRD